MHDNMLYGYDSVPSNYSEENFILENVNSELLIENILDQISVIDARPVDHVAIYIDRIKLLEEEYKESPDIINSIRTEKITFYNRLLDILCEGFDIRIEESVIGDSIEKLEYVVYELYHLLIIDYVENITNLYTHIIIKNKKNIASSIEPTSTKDASTSNWKTSIKNKGSITILSNFHIALHIVDDNFIIPNDDSEMYIDIFELEEEFHNMIPNLLLMPNDNFIEKYCIKFMEESDGYSIILTSILNRLIQNFSNGESFGGIQQFVDNE